MAVRGLFITVEGGEGVGKSTNIDSLKRFLDDSGVQLVVTREPGGTRLGEDIRETLLQIRQGSVDPVSEVLLVFAARAQHLSEVIEPALSAGKWVLCDRFTDATYAYQCGGRGVDNDTVRSLENLVQGGLRPDYTLLFDAPVEIGLERARGRGELDRFEREALDFFERVRATYLARAREEAERFRVIDATLPLEDIQREVNGIGEDILDRWRQSGGAP